MFASQATADALAVVVLERRMYSCYFGETGQQMRSLYQRLRKETKRLRLRRPVTLYIPLSLFLCLSASGRWETAHRRLHGRASAFYGASPAKTSIRGYGGQSVTSEVKEVFWGVEAGAPESA